jgi:hypothetical protein
MKKYVRTEDGTIAVFKYKEANRFEGYTYYYTNKISLHDIKCHGYSSWYEEYYGYCPDAEFDMDQSRIVKIKLSGDKLTDVLLNSDILSVDNGLVIWTYTILQLKELWREENWLPTQEFYNDFGGYLRDMIKRGYKVTTQEHYRHLAQEVS